MNKGLVSVRSIPYGSFFSDADGNVYVRLRALTVCLCVEKGASVTSRFAFGELVRGPLFLIGGTAQDDKEKGSA